MFTWKRALLRSKNPLVHTLFPVAKFWCVWAWISPHFFWQSLAEIHESEHEICQIPKGSSHYFFKYPSSLFSPSSTSRMPIICMLEISILLTPVPRAPFFFFSFWSFFLCVLRFCHLYCSVFKFTDLPQYAHSAVNLFILDIWVWVLEFAFGSFASLLISFVQFLIAFSHSSISTFAWF